MFCVTGRAAWAPLRLAPLRRDPDAHRRVGPKHPVGAAPRLALPSRNTGPQKVKLGGH